MNKFLIKTVVGFLPSFKQAFFADGKFQPQRALILVAALVILGIGYHFLGADGLKFVIDMLDEVSDVIGYEE